MSYNIDSTETLSGKISIRVEDYHLWKDREDLPEGNPFQLDPDEVDSATSDGMIDLNRFWWYGEFSGTSYNKIMGELATYLVGEACVLFTWEGGDSHHIVKFENGKATEHEVKFVAGKKTGDL